MCAENLAKKVIECFNANFILNPTNGTVVLSRGGAQLVVAQRHSGEMVGQMALMGAPL